MLPSLVGIPGTFSIKVKLFPGNQTYDKNSHDVNAAIENDTATITDTISIDLSIMKNIDRKRKGDEKRLDIVKYASEADMIFGYSYRPRDNLLCVNQRLKRVVPTQPTA